MGEVVTFDNTSDNQAAIHYQKANKNEANSITTAQEGMFKKMRRALPVTGAKFDWDKPKLMI